MKKLLLVWLGFFCTWVWATEPLASATASASVPSEEERQETRERLAKQRQTLEDTYTQELKQCYQYFDVTNCRLKARDRRIEANAALRKEELQFNAQERRIQAEETRKNIAERNSDAEQRKFQDQRAAAVAAAKDRADANSQKQIEHELQGTKRGEYEQKQREAAQHRADVEKKLRERSKEPAAPLPVPSR